MTTSSYNNNNNKQANAQGKFNTNGNQNNPKSTSIPVSKPLSSSTPPIASTTQMDFTLPPSEMTINVELGSIVEPLFMKSTTPTLMSNEPAEGVTSKPKVDDLLPDTLATMTPVKFNRPEVDNDTYFLSLNLFTTDGDKHTYSFEKQYYTRSIEFSDYLRTEYNYTKPVVNYFLNETTRESRKDTVSGTIPIWLEKVPTLVTGVVYDAKKLQEIMFDSFMVPNCEEASCRNLCSPKRGMNVSCYLVDEHGIVVLSTSERLSKQNREPIMGQPLFKVNPWLMKRLEFDGIYNLIIPGSQMPECMEIPFIYSSSVSLRNLLSYVYKSVVFALKEAYTLVAYFVASMLPGLGNSSL